MAWIHFLTDLSLCIQTAMRVWDSLLLEGPKVLYRVAIALLKVCMRSVGQSWQMSSTLLDEVYPAAI